MAKEEARFAIKIEDDSSGATDAAAASLEGFRERILASQKAIKELSAAKARLRGSSVEVKNAVKELQTKIEAERNALTQNQLALLKNGTSLERLNEAARAAAGGSSSFGKAVDASGGPLASVRAKMLGMRDALAGIKGAAGFAVLGLGLVVAAVTAVSAAVLAGTFKLAKFILGSREAARSADLLREAATGSGANAYAMGTQVNELARKVATSRAELDSLAVSMAKGGLQGQTLVDSFHAIGQAAGALGEDAGSKLRELLERGKQFQTFQLSPQELVGTGLQFDDVATALAGAMKIGVTDARAALLEGRVKLGAAAAAVREATEKRLGKINLAKQLSFDGLRSRLELFSESLTQGVKIEPVLKGLRTLVDLFDDTTVTGATLKRWITEFGTKFVDVIGGAVPLIKGFAQGMVIGALKIENSWLKVRLELAKTLGRDIFKTTIDGSNQLSNAVRAGELAIKGLAIALGGAAVALAATAAAVSILASPFVMVFKAAQSVHDWIKNADWKSLGSAVIDGITNGVASKIAELEQTLKGVGGKMRAALAGTLKISSPSKVFRELGQFTADGYAEGVDDAAPRAQGAVANMVGDTSTPSSGGRGGGSKRVEMAVTINVQGGGAGNIAQAAAEKSFLNQMQKVLETVVTSGMATT